MKKIQIKVNAKEMLLKRKNKVDGRLAEVRTGCGIHQDKRYKEKYKEKWKNEY